MDIIFSESFSHHVHFSSFMFMYKISTRVVCVINSKQYGFYCITCWASK